MKAIEILFDKIDELNSEIKSEDNLGKKIDCLPHIEQIIKAIYAVSSYPYHHFENKDYF